MAFHQHHGHHDDDDYGFDYPLDDEVNHNRGSNNAKEADEERIGEHKDLDEWERRLRNEVDVDFFQDPKVFHTLQRVIDVLGASMDDNPSSGFASPSKQTTTANISDHLASHNPAYYSLKKQQRVVEDSIEHMAVRHCADLNSSVAQVGKVSRQFSDAVNMVRHLRRQVRDIRETLGSTATANANSASNLNASGNMDNSGKKKSSAGSGPNSNPATTTTVAQATAMSLRELWLKKLECEAVLTLLEKMEIVRSAPLQFDSLIQPPGPCRIGAAVVTLSKAFDIAFHSNVSHVHALQNVSAQITDRKQRADQIIWDTLLDVLYLRTGNPIAPQDVVVVTSSANDKNAATSASNIPKSTSTIGSGDRTTTQVNGLRNPFAVRRRPGSSANNTNNNNANNNNTNNNDTGDDDDDNSVASWFSVDANDLNNHNLMIPQSILEAELDLEADEERCLEQHQQQQSAMGGNNNNSDLLLSLLWDDDQDAAALASHGHLLPRYADHVLALRILVECLAKLVRLDDVERTVAETLPQEIRKLAQKEQAKTMLRLEKTRHLVRRRNKDLKDFRRHISGLLSSFGSVLLRLCHLAQILRFRITTGENLVLFSYQDRASAMHSVIVDAFSLMQKEIREFLQACLKEEEEEDHRRGHHHHHHHHHKAANSGDDSRGLFSLGITESPYKKDPLALQPESRANQIQQGAGKFVGNVLMPKTNSSPEVRHALEFRRSIASWSSECETIIRELAAVSSQDTTSPSYKIFEGETALHFLDNTIKKQLIPVLQHDAINGTTKALERDDAFDPVIDRTLYGKPNSNEPQDVDMCVACQALYWSTGPLFLALHRLPKDEKMYLHVVGVLEHAILTFISRVKPRVSQICNDKMSLRILLDTGGGGREKGFGTIIERRKAFQQLLNAYADGDLLESSEMSDGDLRDPSLLVNPQSSADNKAKNSDKANKTNLDVVGGVEKEEQILAQELPYLQTILEFTKTRETNSIVCCTDEELMKASCLSHSLLKLSSLLESRLKVRSSSSSSGFEKTLTSTRALREAIKTIKAHGLKMAKFCRIDMLMQNAIRLQKICKSSTIVAKDAVRIPSCVNDLGEYLTGASDNLREAGGNAVTAYTFSSLEQYIPLFLMQTVRVIAKGEGIVAKSPLTLNGVEALDRSGSVLYRDLKSATSFDNSYWDDELAAISFERSASFMAMMEVEMEELEAYFRSNHDEFSDTDFQIMFAMNGPRRRGDPGRHVLLKKKMQLK